MNNISTTQLLINNETEAYFTYYFKYIKDVKKTNKLKKEFKKQKKSKKIIWKKDDIKYVYSKEKSIHHNMYCYEVTLKCYKNNIEVFKAVAIDYDNGKRVFIPSWSMYVIIQQIKTLNTDTYFETSLTILSTLYKHISADCQNTFPQNDENRETEFTKLFKEIFNTLTNYNFINYKKINRVY